MGFTVDKPKHKQLVVVMRLLPNWQIFSDQPRLAGPGLLFKLKLLVYQTVI